METQPTQTSPEPNIPMEINLDTDTTKYSKGKLALAILVAMVLGLLVVMGIGTPLALLTNWALGITEDTKKLNWYDIFMYVGALWAFLLIAKYFVNKWRLNDGDINLGLTTFDNPFYDPNYESKAMLRGRDLKEAYKLNRDLAILLKDAQSKLSEQKNNNNELRNRLQVFIRHHENASRLMESATYLSSQQDPKFIDEMINNILSECMTVLNKDRSDKSATLFQIVEDELTIRGYIRIKALSSRTRKFKKGQGFAGHVWEINQSVILNEFDTEKDGRFSGDFKPHDGFKSIIGVPCKIGEETAGILCIQSEYAEGFSNEDLRAVQFYANCCSLIFLYDKIKSEGGVGNG